MHLWYFTDNTTVANVLKKKGTHVAWLVNTWGGHHGHLKYNHGLQSNQHGLTLNFSVDTSMVTSISYIRLILHITSQGNGSNLLCLLRFGSGWFYPYPSGLLHWYSVIVWLLQCQWSNPADMNKCITRTHIQCWYHHNKTQHSQAVCIFYGIYCTMPVSAYETGHERVNHLNKGSNCSFT